MSLSERMLMSEVRPDDCLKLVDMVRMALQTHRQADNSIDGAGVALALHALERLEAKLVRASR